MTTLDVDHSPADASGLLRTHQGGNHAAHRETEQSRFVGALLGGELTTAGYAALLGQTYLVYTSLEEAGRAHADNALVNPFLSDDLLRVAALEADLEFLSGPNWRESLWPCRQRSVTWRVCRKLPSTRRPTSSRTTTSGTWATCPAARSSAACSSAPTVSDRRPAVLHLRRHPQAQAVQGRVPRKSRRALDFSPKTSRS